MYTHPPTSRRHSSPVVIVANPHSPPLSRNSQRQRGMPFHATDPSYAPVARDISPLHGANPIVAEEGYRGHLRFDGSVRSPSQSGHPSISGTANGVISHTVPEVLRNRDESPETRYPAFRTSRTIPLPSQADGRVEVSLHPALRFGYGPGERAIVEMDIASMSVESILQLARNSRALNEPATSPSVSSINLVHPGLPWSITVHPLNPGVTYVTVSDVLYAICQALQLPLREDHWQSVGGVLDNNSLWCRRQTGQNSRTLKRLHLLQGKRNFVGLSRSPAEVALGAEIWRMNFA